MEKGPWIDTPRKETVPGSLPGKGCKEGLERGP
jgi:hypothetical protein